MEISSIRKQVLLKAELTQVWRALTDSSAFGSWFGMKLDGPFRAGEIIRGAIAPTTVDPEVAEMQKPYAGKRVEFFVDRIEPQKLFSFQWHPFAIDPKIDYSNEPMTTVEFSLKTENNGILLTITESGFEGIPNDRREAAFQANDGGWAKQTELLTKYLQS